MVTVHSSFRLRALRNTCGSYFVAVSYTVTYIMWEVAGIEGAHVRTESARPAPLAANDARHVHFVISDGDKFQR